MNHSGAAVNGAGRRDFRAAASEVVLAAIATGTAAESLED